MKNGFDFISTDQDDFNKLEKLEKKMNFCFPPNFKRFVNNYSFSNKSIVVDTKIDELRGCSFPAEAILYKPSECRKNKIYLDNFCDLEDIEDDLKYLLDDYAWLEKGLIIIGYTTDGEKICLGCTENVTDEIWLLSEDGTVENKYLHLENDIFAFVSGLYSVS